MGGNIIGYFINMSKPLLGGIQFKNKRLIPYSTVALTGRNKTTSKWQIDRQQC